MVCVVSRVREWMMVFWTPELLQKLQTELYCGILVRT